MKKSGNLEKGLSIAIIEDNEGDFVLIEDYLYEQIKSVNIVHFSDYNSASKYMQSEDCKCDIILLDLNLPDLRGLELIKTILAQGLKIPIIILTGYSDLPLAKKSLELGIYDFLIKDEINPVLLHKSIEFAISRSNYVGQIENQNEKLKNIAWTQSHVVRAPVARMLGIIDMIETIGVDKEDLPFLLKQLKASSEEIDDIVRGIAKEAQSLNLKK